MNRIISANQSAFIKGRLISDNLLVAHECMHFLKNKRMSSNFDLALKLDMSKAYDRVEWSFIWFITEKLGFCAKWINWLKECVSTVSFSVVVEGQPIGFFKPNRGIRQGDLLSPYLFLLCAEGLSYLLHAAEQKSKVQGLKINTKCPSISHLLFADDSILFCKANTHQCENLLEVLDTYSCNTPQQTRIQLANLL